MFYVIGNETGVRDYMESALQVMIINGSAQGYKTRAQRDHETHGHAWECFRPSEWNVVSSPSEYCTVLGPCNVCINVFVFCNKSRAEQLHLSLCSNIITFILIKIFSLNYV
jgi:hypothetical protein